MTDKERENREKKIEEYEKGRKQRQELSNFVVKDNAIIQKARYNLSATQQKFLAYLISKIKPEDNELETYEIRVEDFCTLIGVDKNWFYSEFIKLIDDFYAMQAYIPKVKDHNDVFMLNLSIVGCPDEKEINIKTNPVNRYIRGLRDKYWSLLFMSNEMGKLLTESARRSYMNQLAKFRDYDFNYSNIKQLQIDMVQNLNQNVDEAILKQFDNFTYKYSLDKATNVHYFNGWRTNDAFMVRSKVIIPMYGIYTRYGSWSWYDCRGYLEELEKCFTYLDGGKTDGDNVGKIIGGISSQKYNGERIHFKYFDVELKKKGTIHIWFTNEELLKKFNIFGCQKHGWLPNSYGKKSYNDMTKEEQNVIDSFEGKNSYENVMSNPQVYLGGNQMLQLMG